MERKATHRTWYRRLRFEGLIALILLLAACTPAAAPTAAPTQPAAPQSTTAPAPAATSAPAANSGANPAWPLPSGNVTINLWDSAEQTKAKLYQETLIPEYQKLHPNVKINYESISTADMLQKLLVALSTGTGPELFVLTDWFMPTYFSKDLLDPVPPEAFGYSSLQEMVNAYVPGRLDMFMKDSKLYAIPYQMNSLSLYINNRLFQEAGLDPVQDAPKTWDDVAKLNEKLTKRQGDRVTQKGFEPRYASDQWMNFLFHTLLYQNGGDVLTDGKITFNQEPGVKSLEVWKSLTTAPKISNNTAASPYQDFADEQDAMTFAPPNAGAVVELLNPKMAGNYTVVALPQMNPEKPASMMYSFNLVVNAKASDDQKKVAWDFIHYVTSQPALWMQKTRMVNPLQGWYEQPEAKQVPYLDVFIHDMSIAKPMVRSDHYNEFQSAIARAIERVVYNNEDPKQSLEQAAAEFERAMNQ